MRFLGNIEAKTDAKGRAFLPAAFRKVLQLNSEERLVLRKDVFQPCLVLYPESVWNEQMDQMRARLNRWNRQQVCERGRTAYSRRQRSFPDPQALPTDGRDRARHQVRWHGRHHRNMEQQESRGEKNETRRL